MSSPSTWLCLRWRSKHDDISISAVAGANKYIFFVLQQAAAEEPLFIPLLEYIFFALDVPFALVSIYKI